MPAAGDEAAQIAVRGEGRVGVDTLGVVLLGELDDLFFAYFVMAEREFVANSDVLEVARHVFLTR